MAEFDIPTVLCPHCLKTCNMSAEADEKPSREPNDGDASVCFYCGGISIFVVHPGGLSLRKATTEEITEITSGLS